MAPIGQTTEDNEGITYLVDAMVAELWNYIVNIPIINARLMNENW